MCGASLAFFSQIILLDELFLFIYFFRLVHFIFALLFSLPPDRNSDPGSHSRLFSHLPNMVRALHCALHFYREKTSALSSLVDSRRFVPTHARRSQQLILHERGAS